MEEVFYKLGKSYCAEDDKNSTKSSSSTSNKTRAETYSCETAAHADKYTSSCVVKN